MSANVITESFLLVAQYLSKSTCQLFSIKKDKKEYIVPFGTGILFSHNKNFYLLSCAHVLIDGEPGTPFIFNGGTETLSIGGEYVSSKPEKGNNRNTDR